MHAILSLRAWTLSAQVSTQAQCAVMQNLHFLRTSNLSDTCEPDTEYLKKFHQCDMVKARHLAIGIHSTDLKRIEVALFYQGCLNPHVTPNFMGSFEQVNPLTNFISSRSPSSCHFQILIALIKRKATREGREPFLADSLRTVAQKAYKEFMPMNSPPEPGFSFGLPKDPRTSVRDISVQLVSSMRAGNFSNVS